MTITMALLLFSTTLNTVLVFAYAILQHRHIALKKKIREDEEWKKQNKVSAALVSIALAFKNDAEITSRIFDDGKCHDTCCE